MKKAFFTILCTVIIICMTSCGKQQELDPVEEIRDGEQKGDRIVEALDTFYKEFGKYPDRLDILVPIYIPEIPHTLAGEDFTFKEIEGDVYYLSFPVTRKKLVTTCSYIKRLENWDCSVFFE